MDEYVQAATTKPTDRTALNIDIWAHADNSLGNVHVDGSLCKYGGKQVCDTLEGYGPYSLSRNA